MSQFEEFCKKIGKKYKNDYDDICNDNIYNELKVLKINLDKNQYLQAAAEQMFYYKLKKHFYIVEYDKNVNPFNDTDVDLCYDGLPFNLRIEIKTPVLFQNTEKDKNNKIVIHGELDHRYPKSVISRKEVTNALNKINNLFNGKAEVLNLRDNKIKDYLESAQKKMIASTKNDINIILICLDSNELVSFFDYIVNPYTGLSSSEPYILPEVYSKIDFIILSNCIEGHLDNNFKFNVWDSDNFVNFVIPNMNKLSSENYEKKVQYIIKLFNDNFYLYNLKRNEYAYLDGNNNDRWGILNYFEKNFPQFIPNKGNRKY